MNSKILLFSLTVFGVLHLDGMMDQSPIDKKIEAYESLERILNGSTKWRTKYSEVTTSELLDQISERKLFWIRLRDVREVKEKERYQQNARIYGCNQKPTES